MIASRRTVFLVLRSTSNGFQDSAHSSRVTRSLCPKIMCSTRPPLVKGVIEELTNLIGVAKQALARIYSTGYVVFEHGTMGEVERAGCAWSTCTSIFFLSIFPTFHQQFVKHFPCYTASKLLTT